jgi:hypothetical protein
MKTILLFLALAVPALAHTSERLINALVMVESSGRLNPPDGDRGKAVGPLQIHAILVRDVNRFAGTRYTHAQARNPAIARQICRLYLNHYATPEKLGFQPTDEHFARIWNGGPRGWRSRSTINYWKKTQSVLRGHNSIYVAKR